MCAKVQTPLIELQTGQKQQLLLTQRLMMSAHMQQALRLLQLPLQELQPFIEEQVVQNPILEIVSNDEETIEDSDNEFEKEQNEEETEVTISDQDLSILSRIEEDWHDHFSDSESNPVKQNKEEEKFKSYLEQSITYHPSLQQHLKQEAHDSFDSPLQIEIAEILIGYIDEFGFMKTPLSEICSLHHFSLKETEKVLAKIQTFEPYGIGAATIQESLLIQLRCLHKENSLAYQIIRDYYPQLLHNQIPLMQKRLKCSYEAIQQAIEKDIAKLDLHPGTHFSAHSNQPIIPDVTIRQENEKLFVEVERDYAPSLRLNTRYLKMLNDPSVSNETKQFIKRHVFSARWLARNLQHRYSTIERIAETLTKEQYAFFTKPDGQLVPMTMKFLAEELNVHESTIARTVSNKYLYCSRGLFPLRTFFTNKYISEKGEDLSSATVKQAIMQLISSEDKSKPWSDEKISHFLKQKGIFCARRTVAKYRALLKIGNAQQRRKFH